MSVRLKLTLWYSGVLALTLLVFALALYFVLGRNLRASVDNDLMATANEVVRSIEVVGGYPGPTEHVILPNVDAFAAPNTYLQAETLSGQVVAHSANLGQQVLPLSQAALMAAGGGKSVLETTGPAGQRIRIYSQPLIWRGQTIGVLEVGRSMVPLDATLYRLRVFLFLGGVLTVLAAGSLGWLLARAALLPIDRVTHAAAGVEEARDLDRRVEYRGPDDELGRLVHTINAMLDRLQAAYRRLEEAHFLQKRFLADASHELRTPLTTIRGNVELLQRAGQANPEMQREALADISSEAARMSRMVHDLLLLARADAGYKPELVPVELAPVLREVARQGAILAGPMSFTADVPEDVGVVMGDVDALKELFLIILDNAFKYTPAGGQVYLTVRQEEDYQVVGITDSGIGVDPAEQEHIFERYYRTDRARKAGGGTGLGLSIAKLISEQHQGRITVDSEPGHGSTFAVWLPKLTEVG
ncbi:MAG TPA: HAMP domain-containing sensor histidine kinase [Spirochaetia bacterium]|nr:HAMP domain-containing sensor histidine kinase [Spirochaetia bacterium]